MSIKQTITGLALLLTLSCKPQPQVQPFSNPSGNLSGIEYKITKVEQSKDMTKFDVKFKNPSDSTKYVYLFDMKTPQGYERISHLMWISAESYKETKLFPHQSSTQHYLAYYRGKGPVSLDCTLVTEIEHYFKNQYQWRSFSDSLDKVHEEKK